MCLGQTKSIVNAFFKAGYIESCGRGINKIVDACKDAGLPEPIIEEDQGGVSINFLKDIYTEDYFEKQNLPTRQVNALLYIKKHGSISNAEYQQLENMSKSTAICDLQELID